MDFKNSLKHLAELAMLPFFGPWTYVLVPHMKGSHADFAPYMKWTHSFRDQKIAKIANSANLQKYFFKLTISEEFKWPMWPYLRIQIFEGEYL